MKPDNKLKKVVLPAPFGPINPVILPFTTLISALLTATRPPNRFVTFLASRMIFVNFRPRVSSLVCGKLAELPLGELSKLGSG